MKKRIRKKKEKQGRIKPHTHHETGVWEWMAGYRLIDCHIEILPCERRISIDAIAEPKPGPIAFTIHVE